MIFSSLHRYRPPGKSPPARRPSSSPFAFFDDPFQNYTSALLFLSTLILAIALIIHLAHLHYHRSKKCPKGCPTCAQLRNHQPPGHIRHLQSLRDCDDEGRASGSSPLTWSSGLAGSEPQSTIEQLTTSDSPNLSLRGGNIHSSDSTPFSTNAFFTTPKSSHPPQPHLSQRRESHCSVYDNHDNSRNKHSNSDPDADLALENARREQRERNRRHQPKNWPATLQKVVVVGDVGEGLIAKRRRMTAGTK